MLKIRLSFYPVSLAAWVALVYLVVVGVNHWYWLIPLSVIFLERLYVQVIILIVGRAISHTTQRFASAMKSASDSFGGPLG